MSINIVVTTQGRAAVVNAQHNGTAPVTIAQVGLSATAITAAPSMTTLAGELKRMSAIAGDVIAADTIHVNMTDVSADAYSLRSFALYLADGTLFALYGQTTPIIEKVSGSDALLAIDVIFADISAASLTFGNTNFLNPPATTERQGVVELATTAEAQAGIDALRALTPAGAKAAILGWLLAQDGSGSGLDADMLDGLHASGFTQTSGATTMTGPLRVAYSNSLLLHPGSLAPTVIHRNDGSTYWLLLTDTGAGPSETWNGKRPLSVNLTSGQVISSNGQSFSGGMDVTTYARFNGNDFWHVGNDGAGSGLDADLLDGLDSGAFIKKGGDTTTSVIQFQNPDSSSMASRPAGNTPLVALGNGAGPAIMTFHRPSSFAAFFGLDTDNRWKLGGWSMGVVDLWHAANDGSGSGLDADLLDGLDSSQFIQVGGAEQTKTGSLNVGTGGALARLGNNGDITARRPDGSGVYYFGNTGARYIFWDGSNYNLAGANLYINGGYTWHAGNDGSGSGLDADMLDGYDSSDFSRLGVGQSFQSMLGSRFINNAYQNTTGKPIQVFANFDNGGSGCTFDVSNNGSTWLSILDGQYFGRAAVIIPNGAWYRLSGAGTTIYRWVELR